MKILVLGGTGYLGSKIVERLVFNEQKIFCTIREGTSIARVQNYLQKIQFVSASINALAALFQEEKIDWIINTACSYQQGEVLYQNILESNLHFPLAVLNLAVHNNISNYMTIGTGLPDEFNMYSFSKKCFSEFGEFYSKAHRMNFLELKLEMFYGSDEPATRFLSTCITKLMNNEDLNLTWGTQRRDIIAVEDVLVAIELVLEQGLEGYHVFSVGTGEGVTIKEIVQYMSEEINSESILNWGTVPMREKEPDSIADIQKLSKIGFKCRYTWKSGLRKMIEEKGKKKDEDID